MPTAVLSSDPNTGSPGISVTLTGSGFASGESVNFFRDSTGTDLLGNILTDAAGSFSVTARAHEAPNGAHSVVAVGSASGKLGVAPFSVKARLVPQPSEGMVGSLITVQGFGFGAGEYVDLYWHQPLIHLGLALTDANGSFAGGNAITFAIPARAATGLNIVVGGGENTHVMGITYVNVQ